MGFICDGRYIVSPADDSDAEKYVDLQISLLGQTYPELIDPDFGARQQANRPALIEEFKVNVSAPGARAFLAYQVPGWTPSGGLSCAVGAAVDWEAPVGLVLSRPGPLDWEADMPVPPVPQGMRELTQLYISSHTQGTGLGQALFDAALMPGEDAYLWYIKGNDRAVSFYQRRGFSAEGIFCDCGGPWVSQIPGKKTLTGRMFRTH